MGVSAAGHLPAITSTSFPALLHCLTAIHGAQRLGAWSVTVRVLRAQGVRNAAGGGGDGAATTASHKSTRTMYVVQLSEFADQTFVLIEDSSLPTRAGLKHEMDAEQALQEQLRLQDAHKKEDGAAARLAGSDASREKQPQTQEQPALTQSDGALDINEALEASKDATTEMKGNVSRPAQEAMQVDSDQGTYDENAGAGAANDRHSQEKIELDPGPRPNRVSRGPTRQTLFTASPQYMLLLTRLNLPPPLGAPTSGEGSIPAGPGAWLPRGAPVVIQGHTYDIPSASEVLVGGEPSQGGAGEWRVRIGMVQSGGTRSAGAIVESEYLPIVHATNDAFLTAHLQSLFPLYLTDPTSSGQQAAGHVAAVVAGGAGAVSGGAAGVIAHGPQPSQWAEVVPASHEAWLRGVGHGDIDPRRDLAPAETDTSGGKNRDEHDAEETGAEASTRERRRRHHHHHRDRRRSTAVAPPTMAHAIMAPHAAPDVVGWHGKERGRRLAFLYVTLLRNQGVL